MIVLGLDLGGTKCLGLAVEDGRVVAEHRLPTPPAPRDVIDTVVAVADALIAATGEPAGIGIGAPGLVDRHGVLRAAPNLPGGDELAIGPEVAARTGRPVVVDNDATCATLGEWVSGAGVGARTLVMVTLGTGIGGGIVADGRISRGANGFAGEVGHMVIDPNGPPCPCGHRGCWERYASGSGLGRLAREAAHAGLAPRVVELAGGDPEMVRGEHVTAALAEGDPAAIRIVADLAWWLALGLANLANIFDPEKFVVGGGLVVMGEALFTATTQAFNGLVDAADRRPPIPISPAVLGERAGAVGAAALATEAAGT
ncbi:MAG: glk [Acidimicrobiales bacterium]|nr:glk [Acidimicrobiales bacterium]